MIWDELAQYKAAHAFLPGYPDGVRNFFSPHDEGVHDLICALLKEATQSIVMNHYGYDDDTADTIVRQKMLDEHVYVQLSLDKSQAGGVHEKKILANWPTDAFGTSVAIGQSAKHAISHLKVCIIDGIYTISGSTNWSLSGEQKQDNVLTLFNSPVIAAEYRSILDANHTEMLKQMARGKADAGA